MLSWALAFLVLALIAALFGFTNVAGTANLVQAAVEFLALGASQRDALRPGTRTLPQNFDEAQTFF